jgi:hypothetical protein
MTQAEQVLTGGPALPWRADLLRTMARCWIAIAGLYYIVDLFGQTRVGWSDGIDRPLGDDFVNTWSGAVLAWSRGGPAAYDWVAYHAFQQKLIAGPIDFYHYGYPPVLLLLSAPLALLPYVPALLAWLAGGVLLFTRTLRLAMPEGAWLLALATPALFLNMIAGQNGAWTAVLLGGGLCLLDRRPVLAGIMFGLLCYKPHLGLLIPIALIAGRQWRAVFAAAATVIILVLGSLLLFGAETWTAYLRTATMLRTVILEDGTGVWHRMLSVFVFARRLGADIPLAYAIQIAAGLAAAAVVAVAWLRDAPAPLRNALLVLGTFLATPYLQDYDLVIGAFAVAWLVAWDRSEPLSPRTFAACALVLVAPLVASPVGLQTGLAVGALLLGSAFVLVARMALQPTRAGLTARA